MWILRFLICLTWIWMDHWFPTYANYPVSHGLRSTCLFYSINVLLDRSDNRNLITLAIINSSSMYLLFCTSSFLIIFCITSFPSILNLSRELFLLIVYIGVFSLKSVYRLLAYQNRSCWYIYLNYLHVKSDVSRNPKFACVGIETDTCGLVARAGSGNAYQTYGCYRHRWQHRHLCLVTWNHY